MHPDTFLAKPHRVKAWNLKRGKELGLAGVRFERERLERANDWVTVTFQPPPSNSAKVKVGQLLSVDMNATEIKTKMFELAGII